MTSTVRKRKRSDEEARSHKIIIACDFGTTFSGAAWVHTGNRESRQIITQWPDAESGGLDGLSSGKVPTEISYEGDRIHWGFETPARQARHAWFKLDLGNSDRLRLFSLMHSLPDPRALPPTYNSEKTVMDYLTAFRKHIEMHIKRALPTVALETTPISYCLTVPAIWDEHAQAKTMSCAKAAGMGADILMISEPEAAATFALDSMNPHGLEVGSTFVLCDAGGGPVDLISYTVLALTPILKVWEAAAGTGGLCGSTFINQRFANFLKEKLSGEDEWDDEVMQEALERFEHIVKRKFSNDVETQYMIPVGGFPDNDALGIRRGKLKLDTRQVKTFFKHVLTEVVALVKGQVRATSTKVKAILLVGGFGQSLALRKAICEAVENDGIEVIQPPNGWTSVVSGALMRALAQDVPSARRFHVSERKARKHYGIAQSSSFQPGLHDELRKFWSPYFGCFRINNMKWVIEKGTSVTESQPVKFRYSYQSQVSQGYPTTASFGVMCCPDIQNTGAPLYKDSENVARLATLTCDFGQIPRTGFKQETGKDGEDYYTVMYNIEVTFLSGSTIFEMVHNGRNLGEVQVEYA